MLGLTCSHRFRALSAWWFTGWAAVVFLLNIIQIAVAITAAALLLAVGLYSLRVPKKSRDLVSVHAELKRRCTELTAGRKEYGAVDAFRDKAVYILKTRRLLLANYQVTVGDFADDFDYEPATMRNVHFITACFYTLSPGVADVRKAVEAAAVRGENDFTLMDDADERNAIRHAFDIVRSPRELNFATVDELREVVAILDKAEPFDADGMPS